MKECNWIVMCNRVEVDVKMWENDLNKEFVCFIK